MRLHGCRAVRMVLAVKAFEIHCALPRLQPLERQDVVGARRDLLRLGRRAELVELAFLDLGLVAQVLRLGQECVRFGARHRVRLG